METELFTFDSFGDGYHFIPDLDNDGLPDLRKDPDFRGLEIYRNAGNLQVSDLPEEKLYDYNLSEDAQYADVNRDGYMDVISKNGSTVHILLNQGNWVFRDITTRYEGDIR